MSVSVAYVHDPMCSWCFGFSKALEVIMNGLTEKVPVRRYLGGLAPDNESPMPEEICDKLQQTWRRIEEEIPGTAFNHDFWKYCQPRRSTYPACRAVIAARAQGEQFDKLMTAAIQRAYYRHARNPSDTDTLVSLADEIGLKTEGFELQLKAATTQSALVDEIKIARSLGISSYPSIAVVSDTAVLHIDIRYSEPDLMLNQIEATIYKL